MSVSTSIKKATRKIEHALTGDEPQIDLLDTLKEEHEMVQDLLEKLVRSDRAAERKSLLKQIKANLVPHVRAEEKVLYDAILALKNKDAQQNGEEGYIEHSLADKTLARLEKIENALSAAEACALTVPAAGACVEDGWNEIAELGAKHRDVLLGDFGFALLADNADQSLGDDDFDGGGDEVGLDAHIDQAGGGAGGVVGVEGGEDQVAGQ